MNSPVSGTEQVGAKERSEAGQVRCPDLPSLLLAELEASRREVLSANRRIDKLLRERKRSREKISRLETIATTDVVTQLVNRRRFDQLLEVDFARAAIHDTPLSVIMVDVDCFKSYNDTFGHAAGDVVLCTVARHLVRSARPNDVVARYGGDEFAILLREADAEVARSCVSRYNDTMASFQWPKRLVAASFGVATRTPANANPASLLEAADRALYLSKRGRRRAIHHVGMSGVSEALPQAIHETSTGRFWVPQDVDHGNPLERESIRQRKLRKGR